MTRIYLDNCTLNRPFDVQTSIRIRIETEAKLFIQDKIRKGELKLIWSYILDFENFQNPFDERKNAIAGWKRYSYTDIEQTESIVKMANEIENKGIKAKDALHIACAIQGNADFFITTDDGILKKTLSLQAINVVNPTDFVKISDEL
jgi:predicted nucleic acid-binding protein